MKRERILLIAQPWPLCESMLCYDHCIIYTMIITRITIYDNKTITAGLSFQLWVLSFRMVRTFICLQTLVWQHPVQPRSFQAFGWLVLEEGRGSLRLKLNAAWHSSTLLYPVSDTNGKETEEKFDGRKERMWRDWGLKKDWDGGKILRNGEQKGKDIVKDSENKNSVKNKIEERSGE